MTRLSTDLGRHRVLLIEDNPGDADLISERLEDAPTSSFEVRFASRLSAAAEVLESWPADLILLDLNLPDSRGIETLRRVLAMGGSAPVLVLSGHVDSELREQARQEGAEDVIAKSEANSPIFFRGVLQIIERERARERHRALENLLGATPDAILVVSLTGVVCYVNEAALTLFSRRREDFIGERLGFSVKDGEPAEIVIPRRDGERICEMRVVQFEWRGEPALVSSIRDLTELKQSQREAESKATLAEQRAGLLRRLVDDITELADRLGLSDVANAPAAFLDPSMEGPSEEKLALVLAPLEVAFRGYVESNAKLEEQNRRLAEAKALTEAANQELDSFSYSVAHDLRAPLRIIRGFSQILVDDYGNDLNDEARGFVGRIHKGAEDMGRLIENMLHLTKVARCDLETRTVDLSELVRQANGEQERTHVERTVEVTIEDNVVAECDQQLLQLVFNNLIGNAWKFTGKTDAPHIEFGHSSDGTESVYFVRDNGAGFDEAFADRLFAVFQRLHAPSEFTGTGVGLSIVKRVIQRHSGRIWAKSVVGEGATFYFTLAGNK